MTRAVQPRQHLGFHRMLLFHVTSAKRPSITDGLGPGLNTPVRGVRRTGSRPAALDVAPSMISLGFGSLSDSLLPQSACPSIVEPERRLAACWLISSYRSGARMLRASLVGRSILVQSRMIHTGLTISLLPVAGDICIGECILPHHGSYRGHGRGRVLRDGADVDRYRL